MRVAHGEVKHRLRVSEDLAAATIAIVLPGLVCALWLAPRAAIPAELPPLPQAAREARDAIERAHALALEAPEGEHAARRRALYEAQNVAELEGEDEAVGQARRAELRAELEAVRAEHGDEAVDAMRAADVERMIPALAGQGSDDERARATGGFRGVLERWGAIAPIGDGAGERGRRVAPELVVRALFAARWNAVHGLPLTSGLGPAELRAYHGWLGFRGEAADRLMRGAALDAYAEAGGAYADEVRGTLAWREGAYEEAADAFERAYADTGVVRLRNHALAAAQAAHEAASAGEY